MKSRDILRQAAVALALAATIAVNALANILPLNGRNTGEISDRFPVKFVPAGYVFSIWGVIYLGLAVFAVYQALPRQRENALLRRIGWLFVLSCAFNIGWLFLWHYERFPLTLLAMFGLLATLLAIYARLRGPSVAVSRSEHWLVRVPFSVYLGWTTVATIANVTIVLYQAGWSGFGLSAATWAIILLAVGLAITAFISVRLGDAAYGAVILWAYAGIVVKQSDTRAVAIAAGIAAAAAAALVAVAWFRDRPRLRTA